MNLLYLLCLSFYLLLNFKGFIYYLLNSIFGKFEIFKRFSSKLKNTIKINENWKKIRNYTRKIIEENRLRKKDDI